MNIAKPARRSLAVSTPNKQSQVASQASPTASYSWKIALRAIGALLGMGILLRLAGLPVPVWVLVATGAALAFVFILPALGGRMQEPEGSPFKKASWGF